MRKIAVLIADDHSVVRMGLATLINVQKDMCVIGEAEGGREAVRLAVERSPDVVIMDLMMPDLDGAAATAEIRRAKTPSKVLILTSYGTAAELRGALKAGAQGAVTKNLSNDELLTAVRTVVAGGTYFSPEIKEALEESQDEPTLTPRQQEVLDSITRGLSNDDIANLLGVSKTRVKQHLNGLYEKLGAANRAEAVAIALRKRLLKI